MNSRKPYIENELDELIRNSLKDRVKVQAPSHRVWKRIRQNLGLEKPVSKPFFHLRSPLMVQIALLFLFIMLGGINSNLLSVEYNNHPIDAQKSATRYTSASDTQIYVDQETTVTNPIVVPPLSQRERQSLKEFLAASTTVNSHSEPLALAPIDMIPHTNSPEGRALNTDINTVSHAASHTQPILYHGRLGAGVVE